MRTYFFRARLLAGCVAVAAVMFLGACGDDENEPAPGRRRERR